MLFKSQNTEAWEMEIHHLAVQVHYPVTEQKMYFCATAHRIWLFGYVTQKTLWNPIWLADVCTVGFTNCTVNDILCP